MERFFAHLDISTRRVLSYCFLGFMWLFILIMLTLGITYAICGNDWVDNNITGKFDTDPAIAAILFVVPILLAFIFWMLYFDCRKRSMKDYMISQDVYIKEGVIVPEEKIKIKAMIAERKIEEMKRQKKEDDKIKQLENKLNAKGTNLMVIEDE